MMIHDVLFYDIGYVIEIHIWWWQHFHVQHIFMTESFQVSHFCLLIEFLMRISTGFVFWIVNFPSIESPLSLLHWILGEAIVTKISTEFLRWRDTKFVELSMDVTRAWSRPPVEIDYEKYFTYSANYVNNMFLPNSWFLGTKIAHEQTVVTKTSQLFLFFGGKQGVFNEYVIINQKQNCVSVCNN